MSLRDWVARRWWRGEGGPAGAALDVVLAPAELLYRGVTSLRNAGYERGWMRSEAVSIPVISVGNVAVGGAGKTPVSAHVAARLAAWGRRPAIALRGYGEDEILVHRELNPGVPVFAAARRVEAARRAADAGCDAVVLDDGFQHRALRRDLDVVLVSSEGWTDRRRVVPRGPWRETAAALRRAGIVLVTRKSDSVERAEAVVGEVRRIAPGIPVARCDLTPTRLVALQGAGEIALDALAGRDVLAVSALADPGPFVSHLRAHAGDVEEAAWPDHHAFTAEEAASLARRAAGRAMVMTRKDAVKLRPLLGDDTEAYVLEQRVEPADGGALDAALRRALEGRA